MELTKEFYTKNDNNDNNDFRSAALTNNSAFSVSGLRPISRPTKERATPPPRIPEYDVTTSKVQRPFKTVRRICKCIIALCSLALLYLFLVYTQIPFIANARTLYIETAMSTLSHQWLATALLPDDVVSAVMDNVNEKFDDNRVERSALPAPTESLDEEHIMTAYARFAALFPDIDLTTMPADITDDMLDNLQISDIASKGIKTTAGDAVYAIDAPNKLLIVNIKGDAYAGKLAIVKDSSKVFLSHTTLKSRGQSVTEQCAANNAVLGVNAGGFIDRNGSGAGNEPVGLVISRGEKVHDQATSGYYQIVGFDRNDVLRVGYGLDTDELRDAAQFYPVIVLDGLNHCDGSYGMGIQPRTAIGQTADGATLLLVVDGRQKHSLGTTVSECADVLLRYGCWCAMNMDGGSSSSMTYNGKMITKTSSPNKSGRKLPNAWLVAAGE